MSRKVWRVNTWTKKEEDERWIDARARFSNFSTSVWRVFTHRDMPNNKIIEAKFSTLCPIVAKWKAPKNRILHLFILSLSFFSFLLYCAMRLFGFCVSENQRFRSVKKWPLDGVLTLFVYRTLDVACDQNKEIAQKSNKFQNGKWMSDSYLSTSGWRGPFAVWLPHAA